MAIHDYNLTEITISPQTRLPSHLRHLTITGFSKRVDNAVSRLIKSSSSSLTSIKLERSDYFGSTFSSVLPALGPKLQRLEVTPSHNSILSSLLPHCTSLKSLSIHSYDRYTAENFKFIIDTLGTIPKSVILESFCIQLPSTSTLVHLPYLVQLLQTSPFGQLKRIYLCIRQHDDPRQELVDLVRGNDDFMELLGNRGTMLGFGTEEQLRLEAEKKKQRIYKKRQDKLVLVSKE